MLHASCVDSITIISRVVEQKSVISLYSLTEKIAINPNHLYPIIFFFYLLNIFPYEYFSLELRTSCKLHLSRMKIANMKPSIFTL